MDLSAEGEALPTAEQGEQDRLEVGAMVLAVACLGWTLQVSEEG